MSLRSLTPLSQYEMFLGLFSLNIYDNNSNMTYMTDWKHVMVDQITAGMTTFVFNFCCFILHFSSLALKIKWS